jgi:hypothetical protein
MSKLEKLIYTLFVNLVIYVFIKLSYQITLELFFWVEVNLTFIIRGFCPNYLLLLTSLILKLW